MDDPIASHPTRAEQLDILADIIAEVARDGDSILDLGVGAGYVERLIAAKRDGLRFVGVDLQRDKLDDAERNLSGHDFVAVRGDLSDADGIAVPDRKYRFAISALVFHDLDDGAKRNAIAWAASRLASDGWWLLYDRLRLDTPETFTLQRAIWNRIERVHGRGMRRAEDFRAYERDLVPNNRPARLTDYARWFGELNLAMQVLHLHGNVALLAAGVRPGRLG